MAFDFLKKKKQPTEEKYRKAKQKLQNFHPTKPNQRNHNNTSGTLAMNAPLEVKKRIVMLRSSMQHI